MTSLSKSPVREALVKMFLDSLYQDRFPWSAGWIQLRPRNAVNEKNYRGINRLYLSQIAEDNGWTDPRWCTFKQAKEKGWHIMKGAKASHVEYWAFYDTIQQKLLSWEEARKLVSADPTYEKDLRLNCRTYAVFNAAQIEGIPPLKTTMLDIGDLRQCRDTLINNIGVGFRSAGDRAYYSPSSDCITLPPETVFHDKYLYMSTFLHEAGHATGHPSRLDRNLSVLHGSDDYAKEELRAEIASAFVAQDLRIPQTDRQNDHHRINHAAYIQSWIAKLEKDPDELFRAVNDAETIADYLIEKGEFNLSPDKAAEKAESTMPVGRIDYLTSRGRVGESIEYTDAGEFVEDIRKENYYGSPMIITVYSDPVTGKHIDTSWRLDLDPPPQGFKVEPYSPDLGTEPEVQKIGREAISL